MGFQEVSKHLSKDRVNHIVLLTDGQTYDNEGDSLNLAEQADALGISISGFGIGQDWNDHFLDALTEKSGSNSNYIAEPQQIQDFLEKKY